MTAKRADEAMIRVALQDARDGGVNRSDTQIVTIAAGKLAKKGIMRPAVQAVYAQHFMMHGGG